MADSTQRDNGGREADLTRDGAPVEPRRPGPVGGPRRSRRRPPKIATFRPWVQGLFALVWLAPFLPSEIKSQTRQIPGCTFHCYACPWFLVGCPVGITAQFLALSAPMIPLMTLGVIIAIGGLVGSLVCGWACPFGFLQDLLAKVPTPKWRPPQWTGYGRYVTLILLVVLVPLVFGREHPLFFCSVCPAGALEASLPRNAQAWFAGAPMPGITWYKAAVLAAVLAGALFIHRPWCRMLCPLGGALALFNRFSVLYLRFDSRGCSECNLCRTRCRYGVKVDESVNNSSCVRCLECTACPALKLRFGK